MTTRRAFLAASAAAPLAAASPESLKLGVASYTFRQFTREEMIEAVRKIKTPYLSVKEFHLPYSTPKRPLAMAVKQFKDAGLETLSGGNIDLKGDEKHVRKMFEYAKAAGFPLIVCAPSRKNVDVVERMVKEFNIKVAIHNHGPEDKEFPTPQSVLELVKNMDPRMGLCIDVGHTARTGVNVVESLRLAGPRLLDLHIKDLRNLMDKDSQCITGEGKMPVKEIFSTLIKMKYTGGVMLEYEIEEMNPLPGAMKSVENMRRILASLKS